MMIMRMTANEEDEELVLVDVGRRKLRRFLVRLEVNILICLRTY